MLFGNPETTSGGQALKYYASMRLDIRAKDKIMEAGRVEPVGNKVKVKVVKNKVRGRGRGEEHLRSLGSWRRPRTPSWKAGAFGADDTVAHCEAPQQHC